jgi:hypothetical protein
MAHLYDAGDPSATTSFQPVGTPHLRGSRRVLGDLRAALRDLAWLLVTNDYPPKPVSADKLALDVIEVTDQLSPTARHIVRMVISILIREGHLNSSDQ